MSEIDVRLRLAMNIIKATKEIETEIIDEAIGLGEGVLNNAAIARMTGWTESGVWRRRARLAKLQLAEEGTGDDDGTDGWTDARADSQ